ncbi:hypothetical protein [Mycobacterium sp. IEC1808]|uniref:hypothetical protein n=1 Tax=Mycobacterium sp. IEC1808 TaxID=1743230 RepID=UPI001F4DFFC4|nr:hypothetical protein [Mycobacterium sp. IEC1808]
MTAHNREAAATWVLLAPRAPVSVRSPGVVVATWVALAPRAPVSVRSPRVVLAI